MAQIKITSIAGRTVTLNVTWDNGLTKTGVVVSDVPVESFVEAREFLFGHISGMYQAAVAEAAAIAYANPIVDPMVTAAIGHTFDDLGNILL